MAWCDVYVWFHVVAGYGEVWHWVKSYTVVNMESSDHTKMFEISSKHTKLKLFWAHAPSKLSATHWLRPDTHHIGHIVWFDFFQPLHHGWYWFGEFLWQIDDLTVADGRTVWASVRTSWSSLQVMFLLFVAVEDNTQSFWAEFSLNHLRCSRILPSCSPPVPPPCRCPTPPLWRSACPRRSTGSWCCSAPCTARTPAERAARPRSGGVQSGCRGYRRKAGTPAPLAVPRQRRERWGCVSWAARPTPSAPPRAPGA